MYHARMAGCSLTGGAVLQFILIFTTPPVTRDKVIARFLETGGQPPPGVRQLGRWTQLDLCGGMVLLENDNPQALTAFAHASSDVVHLTLVPRPGGPGALGGAEAGETAVGAHRDTRGRRLPGDIS